jgi:hypothetical protein
MATSPPPINQFTGATPQRGDRSTFSARVDAFVTWLIAFVVQLPALAANVYANALEAFQSAGTATAAAAAAMATVNATPWVSGTTYAKNLVVISQVNFQNYRRAIAGAGTTDPANDPTNWSLLSGNDSNGAFTPVPLSGSVIDLANGSNYFTKTISANTTFSIVLPSNARPTNATPPAMLTNRSHLLMFVTKNGGGLWRVTVAANFALT